MANAIIIKIQPLTPMWTGDADRRGERIQATGVLGSLRWWYEALLRGLGQYACDPAQGACIYDKDKGHSSICLACQVFGCTGFSRRFRLMLEGGGDAGQLREVRLKHPGTNNHRGWRIPPNLAPQLQLTFLPLGPSGFGEFERGALFFTLTLIEHYGALGAKTSHGQGIIRVTDWDGFTSHPSLDRWKAELEGRPRNTQENPLAPDMSDFVGVTLTLDTEATAKARWWKNIPLNGLDSFRLNEKSMWIPSAPAVRAHLRTWLRDSKNTPGFQGNLQNERHRVMGIVQGQDTRGSNIFVTHLYRPDIQSPWVMRIFGFVPRGGNEVDQALRTLLRDSKQLAVEVATSLGGIAIDATPYPEGVDALLADPRKT